MYVEDAVSALPRRFGPCFAQIYGQGESPMTITRLLASEIGDRAHPALGASASPRLVSPHGNVESRDRRRGGECVPPGEAGESSAAAPGSCRATGRMVRRRAKTLALWLVVHRRCRQPRESAYLSLKDRSKDLIISGGTNIYPREVEKVVLTNPDVREGLVDRAPPSGMGRGRHRLYRGARPMLPRSTHCACRKIAQV